MFLKGRKITQSEDCALTVPDDPIIPFIEGDGIGPDIWKAAAIVLDGAVVQAYGGRRKIFWKEILAGEKASKAAGKWLPQETVDHIRDCLVAIKGPLTTPIGGGFRSINVALRQILDLYACVRPVRYFQGVPSPVKNPQNVNMVIFRENTEDVYAGYEWPAGSPEAAALIEYLNTKLGCKIRTCAGVGIKPVSEFASKRLIRKAIRYAIDHQKPSVTMVHKGNIMKYTEGAFRDWGYEVARTEFSDRVVTEEDLYAKHEGKMPPGKVLLKDRLADSMFQQVLIRPLEYHVLALPNLNGDYMSDALAAQVGGLGLAPGANISDACAVFEATHGTAPKYAGQDKVNPSSLILSGVMMLEYLGWQEAADMVLDALQKTIAKKTVTYDLAAQMEGATQVKCSEFAQAIVENM